MTIREEFNELRAELREIKDILLARQTTRQPAESPNDVLSLEEAARYVGLQPRTLRTGKAGTASIPRYSDRPVKFLRASLDAFKRARVERNARRGQEPKRPLSLVRRKKTA